MNNTTFYMETLQQESFQLQFPAEKIDELLQKINSGYVLSKAEYGQISQIIKDYETGGGNFLSKDEYEFIQKIKKEYEDGKLGSSTDSCKCEPIDESDITDTIGSVDDDGGDEDGMGCDCDHSPFTDADIDAIWDRVVGN